MQVNENFDAILTPWILIYAFSIRIIERLVADEKPSTWPSTKSITLGPNYDKNARKTYVKNVTGHTGHRCVGLKLRIII